MFVDMSLSETLYHLIVVGATQPGGGNKRDGLVAEASALQKRFRVPDKRFWHIKIKVKVQSTSASLSFLVLSVLLFVFAASCYVFIVSPLLCLD